MPYYDTILDQLIKDQTVGAISMAYGSPVTLTLSSASCQVISNNDGEAELIFINDDIEILQGSK